MNIVVPDELLHGTGFVPEKAMLDLAIGLYADCRVTLGQAAALAAMPQVAFLRELGRLKVPVHYDTEDFASDMAMLDSP